MNNIPQTWISALNQYLYPVDFSHYHRKNEFPDFFNKIIAGNRASTIIFENCLRDKGKNHVEPFFEVVFWKMYSQPQHRQKRTDSVVDFVMRNNIQSHSIFSAIQSFTNDPTIENLQIIRNLLGIKTRVLPLALTYPALIDPHRFPMIDSQVAQWVNWNYLRFNKGNLKLKYFKMNFTSLQDNDFTSYRSWVLWCRDMARVLTNSTNFNWRARDVEMAIFTAQRNCLNLNEINL